MRKLKNSKGFTLMEMLIVIAIIAVLIAIAIPVFTANLNKARVATDEANIRSGYASAVATVLSDGVTTGKTYYLQKDGSVTENSTGAYTTQGNAKKVYTSDNAKVNIAGQSVTPWEKGKTVSYTYNADEDTVSINDPGSTPSTSSSTTGG